MVWLRGEGKKWLVACEGRHFSMGQANLGGKSEGWAAAWVHF